MTRVKKISITLLILLAILFIIALAGSIKFPMSQSFRVVFGSFYVLFLPGFIWSYVFFESKQQDNKITKQHSKKTKEMAVKELDGIERILLSFALSLALSPLVLFFLNRVGLKITLGSSFLVILGIIIIGMIIIFIRAYYKKQK